MSVEKEIYSGAASVGFIEAFLNSNSKEISSMVILRF